MAKIIRILKTVRNHWKKSTFAFCAVAYGISYVEDRYRVNQMMRAYCQEAKNYGEMSLPANDKARHITVILNPKAKNGKGKALFQDYAAPLFYLAGMKVSIFQTDEEGQAKDLMEVMDNTDAVVVAGGNGTLHEVVTGLLRREDSEAARLRFPIGVVPIGKTNSLAKSLFLHSNDAQLLAESAMAVIKEVKKPLDVMKIEGTKGKPVYAVSNLELGVFKDADSSISKYWYFGPLKKKAAYFVRALKEWPANQEFELSYVYPCTGCSKCYEAPLEKPVPKRRWWQSLIPHTTEFSGASTKQVHDCSNIRNDECGTWHAEQIPAPNIVIETENLERSSELPNKKSYALNVLYHSPSLTRWQFIREGGKEKTSESEETGARNIMKIRELKLFPKELEGKQEWYNIDGETYEVQPIHIKLLPDKLFIYAENNKE